jgi:hypothetical protein
MKEKTNRFYAVVLIVIFLLIISIPLFINTLGLYKAEEVSKSENRNLEKKPTFNLAKLDPFPQAYEKWYNDHFIYREDFLYVHNRINFLIGKSPAPENVILGRNNWLYYNVKERDLYEGKYTIPNDSIQLIVKELKYRIEELNRRKIKFYLLIAPIKAEVYPEYLPRYIQRTKGKTVTDKFIEAFKSNPEINLITCKEELIKEKSTNQVYFKYDNHWNEQGAYIAYQLLIKRISKDFPSVNIFKTFTKSREIKKGGNLANMIGLDNLLSEPTIKLIANDTKVQDATKGNYPFVNELIGADEYQIAKTTNNPKLPKAVIIRDSFFGSLLPMVSENFNRSVYIFDSWKYRFNLDIIEAEKPDVVILEIYEPHISNIFNNLIFKQIKNKK